METNRDFKGIWIPKEVWLDERLNALEKIILMEIDSLDSSERGCFASNHALAEFCQCGENKISVSISKLIKLGYLYVQNFDGRTRELKSSLAKKQSLPCEKQKAAFGKTKENNINNNNKDNIDKYMTVAETPRPTQHKYGEFKNVLLKDEEYAKLMAKDNGADAIEFYSEYKARKGYKCKSDYLSILKWVFKALEEQSPKQDNKSWLQKLEELEI